MIYPTNYRWISLTEELELQAQPEAVLAAQRLLNGEMEVLIKWVKLLEHENS